MRGSFIVVAFFVAGCLTGWILDIYDIRIEDDPTRYILYFLMLQVGLGVGSDKHIMQILKTVRLQLLLVPVATIIGTLLFSILAAFCISQWSIYLLAFREVKEDLIRRLGADRVRSFAVDGQEALAVKAHYPSFEKMNLGLPTDEIRAVKARRPGPARAGASPSRGARPRSGPPDRPRARRSARRPPRTSSGRGRWGRAPAPSSACSISFSV